MEPVTITRDQLASALARWEQESRAENWPERADEQRHADNADYLLALIANS